MLDVAQPLMAAAPRFVSALLSGFAAPAPNPTIRGFAAYFNAYTPSARDLWSRSGSEALQFSQLACRQNGTIRARFSAARKGMVAIGKEDW